MADPALPTDIVEPILRAALKGAHMALLRKKEGLQVGTKDAGVELDSGTVTNGDYQSEQVIVAELKKSLPALRQALGVSADTPFTFLMEEEQLHDYAGRQKGYAFVIDPIDGTVNYSGKNPEDNPWCVSIGLEKDGKTIASGVYQAGKNEYTRGLESHIDPDRPEGKLYWADAGVPNAHMMDGGSGGLTVQETGGAQNPYLEILPAEGAVKQLAGIPELRVDYSGSPAYVLDKHTAVQADARVKLDGFMPDIDESKRRNKLELKYHGPIVTAAKQAIAQDCGLGFHQNYSNVNGGLSVADGSGAGYICGRGQPWDHSAIRLIMEKAGAPMVEYNVPGYSGERSMIIASRHPELIKATIARLGQAEQETGQPVFGELIHNANDALKDSYTAKLLPVGLSAEPDKGGRWLTGVSAQNRQALTL